MTHDQSSPEYLKAEIDILPWAELVRHFAFGRLYVVRQPWSLIGAASTLKSDDTAALKSAMSKHHFGLPTSDEVILWQETGIEFEVLVISPFVLVQPLQLSSFIPLGY